ncbi:hypothetical protein [Massilia sp. BKSP1R2A-1]
MHVEVPESHSFEEFAGEYITIVVNIITAPALESRQVSPTKRL